MLKAYWNKFIHVLQHFPNFAWTQDINRINREKWIHIQVTSLPVGDSILDLGAGPAPFKASCSHLKYFALDPSKYQGNDNIDGLQAVHINYDVSILGDAQFIPLKDNSVNHVLCTEVLEHLPNPRLVLEESARVTKPGGKLIFTAPFNSLVHYAPFYHYSGFSKWFYRQAAADFGLSLDCEIENGDWGQQIIQELGRFATSPAISGRVRNLPWRIIIRAAIGIVQLASSNSGLNRLSCFGFMIVFTKLDSSLNRMQEHDT